MRPKRRNISRHSGRIKPPQPDYVSFATHNPEEVSESTHLPNPIRTDNPGGCVSFCGMRHFKLDYASVPT